MTSLTMQDDACPICGAASTLIGAKHGRYEPREFVLRRCPGCRLAFVANPWTDYPRIYSEDYYAGRGADHLVDYLFELEHPEQTLRRCEWRGIVRAVRSLYQIDTNCRWLDYGCGNGGLVRYVREQNLCDAVGFEEGWIAGKARQAGIPILEAGELGALAGTFDIVTAIEVLEHIRHPLPVLRQIRTLLKPGGLFFFTTGNAQPQRNLLSWGYFMPEVHISLFEPATTAFALAQAGFEVDFRGFLPGFVDIIRYKALKTVGITKRKWWHDCMLWPVLSRLLNYRLKVSGHPVGWAR